MSSPPWIRFQVNSYSSNNTLVISPYTLPTDQLFDLEFQFESVFNLEFQTKFGIQLVIPIPTGINLGECRLNSGTTNIWKLIVFRWLVRSTVCLKMIFRHWTEDCSMCSQYKIKISSDYWFSLISWHVQCFRKFPSQSGSVYSADPNTSQCILKGSKNI